MYYRPLRLMKFCGLILCLIGLIYELYRSLNPLWKKRSVRQMLITNPVKENSTIERILMRKEERVKVNDEYEEMFYRLEPFVVHLPNLPDKEAKDWFYNCNYYQINSLKCPNKSCETNGVLFNEDKHHLNVKLSLIKNGLYLDDECGYNYEDSAMKRTFTDEKQTNTLYDKALIYTVPDGWSFQHFLDGVGPKLSHSRQYLKKYPDAKVLIQRGFRFDRSVKEIWAMLGVEESTRIVHYSGGMKVGARLLINPCRTPGIHPHLWHEARLMYWDISNTTRHNDPSKRKNFIYIQRTSTNAANGARLILNEEPFIELLKEYCVNHSLNYVQYDHSKDRHHISYRIQLFYDSLYIIGVHSGALSNMNFAQSQTTVIEIMPYREPTKTLPMTCSSFSPNDLKACAGYILYTQSQLLNQTYWMLPTMVNPDGNMNVDLSRMNNLLRQI